MTRLLNITLPDEIRAALVLLARAERRRPQDQAAILLTEALVRSGFLEVVRSPEREPAEPAQ